jgi:hypothetical protein
MLKIPLVADLISTITYRQPVPLHLWVLGLVPESVPDELLEAAREMEHQAHREVDADDYL